MFSFDDKFWNRYFQRSIHVYYYGKFSNFPSLHSFFPALPTIFRRETGFSPYIFLLLTHRFLPSSHLYRCLIFSRTTIEYCCNSNSSRSSIATEAPTSIHDRICLISATHAHFASSHTQTKVYARVLRRAGIQWKRDKCRVDVIGGDKRARGNLDCFSSVFFQSPPLISLRGALSRSPMLFCILSPSLSLYPFSLCASWLSENDPDKWAG